MLPAFRLLSEQVCAAAFDNSDEAEPTKCYPGTRTLILERMEHWVALPGNAARLLTWLESPMGAGKTSLARTMAERTSANKKLLGIFIFRRGHAGREDESRFITTLAYQLVKSIPLVQLYVEEQITNDPSILQQSLQHQLDRLILGPLRQMRDQHPEIDAATLPNLIIVDGLDECGADKEEGKEERQIKVLQLLHLIATSQDILPFAILVHSRPERHIKSWFTMDKTDRITQRFTLDASYKPEDDIRLFVTQSFLKLLSEHPSRHLIPPDWPYTIHVPQRQRPLNAIDILVEQSSGQFIYASIAMKFISSYHYRPDRRLLLLLAPSTQRDVPQSKPTPSSIMDSLYLDILKNTDEQQTVMKVLGFEMVTSFLPRDIPLHRTLSVLSISMNEFSHCLEQLESLLTIGTPSLESYNSLLKFHHSSLSEFLRSEKRSRHWYVNTQNHALDTALRIFKLFQDETNVEAQTQYLKILDLVSTRVSMRA
ncbi:hypothetical protein BJ165DRAFT_1533315 [Panaeolus papilionaceus]|nr:hypothetical protein BJ165DRAFT_1533315 [Panaeolus papilionaceus]